MGIPDFQNFKYKTTDKPNKLTVASILKSIFQNEDVDLNDESIKEQIANYFFNETNYKRKLFELKDISNKLELLQKTGLKNLKRTKTYCEHLIQKKEEYKQQMQNEMQT